MLNHPVSLLKTISVLILPFLILGIPGQILATVTDQITYQGFLTDPSGEPVDSSAQMRFRIYDAETDGSVLHDTDNMTVSVSDGFFTVSLDPPQAIFDGRALWLQIDVAGFTLSPRQEITPAPYALGLRPGTRVQQVATGTALRVESTEGIGFSGLGQVYGVYGSATGPEPGSGFGGYFESPTGIGVFGTSTAVPSVDNSIPAGVYGFSEHGAGIYGAGGEFAWSGYFEKDVRIDGSLVVGESIFADDKSGYVFDVAVNDDTESLTLGDVVVVTGFDDEWFSDRIPVARIRLATDPESTAVIGIVDRRRLEDERGMARMVEEPARPGDHLGFVTLGAFKAIKVDASYGAIRPGNLLVSSPNPGHAMRSDHPAPGTIIGKAMGELTEGTGTVPVMVTLH